MRGIISAAATCPTGGWPGRTSPPSWAAAAGRGPGRWRPTTRTRRHWLRGGTPRFARAPGRTPDIPVVRHVTAGVPRQDQRHRGWPRRYAFPGTSPPSTSAARSARAWARSLPRSAVGRRPSSSAQTCGKGCRRAATRPVAATPAAPCWSGDGPEVLAEVVGTASATDEFTDRWRAPVSAPPGCGRSASVRTATWHSGQDVLSRALGDGRARRPGIGHLIVTGMHGRAVSGLIKKSTVADGVAADDLARPWVRAGRRTHSSSSPASWKGPPPTARHPVRSSSSCTWPTGPTPSSCARPRL